jgi:apolipoprotein D and lipocalin family protein
MKYVTFKFECVCFLGLLVFSVISCGDSEIKHVNNVSRSSFMGTWYEVAALPTSFNKGCSCSKVDLQSDEGDDYVKMIYSCIKKEKQGAVLAKIFTSGEENFSRWRLQYFWPFRNTLYVVALDSNYTYAMIAGPDRDFLQILSRTKSLDESVVRMLVSSADSMGFAAQALVFPEQKCD